MCSFHCDLTIRLHACSHPPHGDALHGFGGEQSNSTRSFTRADARFTAHQIRCLTPFPFSGWSHRCEEFAVLPALVFPERCRVCAITIGEPLGNEVIQLPEAP